VVDPQVAAFSGPDMMIIFVVALVVFGPKRLPELGKQLGQAVRELRKMTEEVSGVWQGTQDDLQRIIHTDPEPPTYTPPAEAATPLLTNYESADSVRDETVENDEPDERHVFSTLPPSTGDER